MIETSLPTGKTGIELIQDILRNLLAELDEFAEEIRRAYLEHRNDMREQLIEKYDGKLTNKEIAQLTPKVGVVLKKRAYSYEQIDGFQGEYMEVALVLYLGYRKSTSLMPRNNVYEKQRILDGKRHNIPNNERFFYEQMINHINKHRRNVEDIKQAMQSIARYQKRKTTL